MILQDIKELFCELLKEVFKNSEQTVKCRWNCNCNK